MKLLRALIVAACLMLPSPAVGASWTDPGYLYRYFFWGMRGLGHKDLDYQLFPYREIENAPPAFHFAPGPADAMPATVEYRDGDTVKRVALDDLLRSTGTHAFIVVRDDRLLYENYFNGYQRDSICVSRSIAKSVTSALVGIAIADGFIRSVNDPITDYLPELKDRPGFDSITIRNLLTMGSGIRFRLNTLPWDEDPIAYFHPQLSGVLLSDLEIVEPPGQSFHYSDYNTELVALILKRATHRSLSEYLQEKIWKPLGMEYSATWSIDSFQDDLELAFVLLNARAIDFAKFGRLFLNHGNWNGKQIIPEQWVVESTTIDPNDRRPWDTYPEFHPDGGYYKYFWWGYSHGGDDYTFKALGTWGQFIFVSPRTRVVIVRTAGDWGIDPVAWQQVAEDLADHVGSAPASRGASIRANGERGAD